MKVGNLYISGLKPFKQPFLSAFGLPIDTCSVDIKTDARGDVVARVSRIPVGGNEMKIKGLIRELVDVNSKLGGDAEEQIETIINYATENGLGVRVF